MKHYLTQDEVQELFVFLDYHRSYPCDKISLEFIQTGIGVATTVRCTSCDQAQNITDYSTW